MKTTVISSIILVILFIPDLCSAQTDFGEPWETLSTFGGAQFYSRTLKGETEEKAQQFVFPITASGQVTESLSIGIYQTISSSQLEEGPSLSGLQNTRINGALSLLGNSFVAYMGLGLPIASPEPEAETAHLSNLLYSEVLQFGVSRTTEGFNFDTGFVFARPLGNLSLGFGAGYIFRGSYDRLSPAEELVDYNPGDMVSATGGLGLRAGLASLRARLLYVYYGNDKIDEDDALKSGSEFSFLTSARFRLRPLILTVFLTDTIKGESESLQEWINVNNLFSNRLNGGVSLAYPFLNEALILKAQARIKGFFDDGDTSANVASFDGGLQLIPGDKFKLDVLASFITGDMDFGETQISGFGLGLMANYGF